MMQWTTVSGMSTSRATVIYQAIQAIKLKLGSSLTRLPIDRDGSPLKGNVWRVERNLHPIHINIRIYICTVHWNVKRETLYIRIAKYCVPANVTMRYGSDASRTSVNSSLIRVIYLLRTVIYLPRTDIYWRYYYQNLFHLFHQARYDHIILYMVICAFISQF